MCNLEALKGYTVNVRYVAKVVKTSESIARRCIVENYPNVVIGRMTFVVLGFNRLKKPQYSLPDLYDVIHDNVMRSMSKNGYAFVSTKNIYKEVMMPPQMVQVVRSLLELMWPDGVWLNRYKYMLQYKEPRPLEDIVDENIRQPLLLHDDSRAPMPIISFHLPRSMLEKLNEYAASVGKTRSEVIREALEKMLKKYSQQIENTVFA
ncbi:MAG: ribbon-helix-helix domain-containing protein [Pyrobaculum sp.]